MEFQSKIMIKVIGLNLIDALAFEKKKNQSTSNTPNKNYSQKTPT